jgi:hypothetical protein
MAHWVRDQTDAYRNAVIAKGLVKGKKTDKMAKYYDKGLAKLAEGKPGDSVKEFGKVFEHARVDPTDVGM